MVAIVDETFCGHTHTHTQTNTQVILYLSNAMNCIGQTKMVNLVLRHTVDILKQFEFQGHSKPLSVVVIVVDLRAF